MCARDRGPGRRRLPGQDPGKDLQAPEPSWPPTPDSLPSHVALARRSAASTSPTAATRDSNAPCSPPPPCAPSPFLGPTTNANATRANHLGPSHPHPAPPPHHGPARHDPQHPPTSHETTHRRLTHHIGAPHATYKAEPHQNRCIDSVFVGAPVIAARGYTKVSYDDANDQFCITETGTDYAGVTVAPSNGRRGPCYYISVGPGATNCASLARAFEDTRYFYQAEDPMTGRNYDLVHFYS